MSLLRTLIFTSIFYLGSAIIVIVAVLLLPFGEKTAIRSGLVWARFHYWCARMFLGIRTRIEGNLATVPTLYACKHESMYETAEVLRLFIDPVVVFKRELLTIPGWGWVAKKHGVIPIDREAGAGAVRALLTAAKKVRAEGRNVVIFPEGTRVPHGESPPLKAGFAGLYKALGLPVIPIAMDSGRVWPRGGFVKRSGTVTFRFGEPIPPGLPRDEIEARVHAAINALND
ncbi:Phospholipid/glycerol acyltransferase domain-containing protein [Sphingomonas antarctica]|uniref:lysophospholipid acyltransferase family protein n=1 Tax=Sphingomonas antarctica TaxID=2040274 RepID=UPI0039E7B22D